MKTLYTMNISIALMCAATCASAVNNPDFLFMVEHAVMAPSGHNSQPWKFRISDNAIELIPDMSKAVPVVDPDHGELFISVGCALENLCIAAAAKGYSCRVSITDSGIVTVFPEQSGCVEDPLLRQIPLRQTNRGMYNGAVIPQQKVESLSALAGDGPCGIYFYANGSKEFGDIRTFIAEGNRLQMKDPAFRNELKSWMRYNGKQSAATRDGLAYDVFGAPNLPRFISAPAINMALNARRQVKGDDAKAETASHLVLFTCDCDSIVNLIELGRLLQRFALAATEAGIAHSYFNQPNEIPALSARMAATLGLGGKRPAILLRVGYGSPMPYSKRRELRHFLAD